MSEFYDVEADGGWTQTSEWTQAYMPRRSAQVDRIRRGEAQPRLNPVNGHALECACPACPGWYEARARMAVAAQAYSEPVVKPVQPRPMMDVVLPVSVLMMVFSLCAIVVIPVVTPLVLMSAMGLGLIAVCFAIIAVVGLALVGVVRRTAREADVQPVRRRNTIVGQVLGR